MPRARVRLFNEVRYIYVTAVGGLSFFFLPLERVRGKQSMAVGDNYSVGACFFFYCVEYGGFLQVGNWDVNCNLQVSLLQIVSSVFK